MTLARKSGSLVVMTCRKLCHGFRLLRLGCVSVQLSILLHQSRQLGIAVGLFLLRLLVDRAAASPAPSRACRQSPSPRGRGLLVGHPLAIDLGLLGGALFSQPSRRPAGARARFTLLCARSAAASCSFLRAAPRLCVACSALLRALPSAIATLLRGLCCSSTAASASVRLGQRRGVRRPERASQ